MNHSQRIQLIFQYIEEHLDDALDLDVLSRHAYLSKYHFQRFCTAHFGISATQLVKLLRLKKAAFLLAYRKPIKVVDIAVESGFSSHEGFSRAFKQHFNQSPSDFRKSADWSLWNENYQSIVSIRNHLMTNHIESIETHFQVDMIDFPEIQVACMTHKGSPRTLGSTISQFIAWRKLNRLSPTKSRTFNFLYGDPKTTPDDEFQLDLACELSTDFTFAKDINNSAINLLSIPSGRCAKIRHIGSDDTIDVAVNYLYSTWFKHASQQNTPLQLRDFPLFFERVSFFPDVSEHEMITDIFLPIE